MVRLLIIGACFFSLLLISEAAISYIAAALEHNPIQQSGPVNQTEAQQIMLENLAIYEEYIQIAVPEGAQIIVFPEYGLFGENFSTRDSIYPYLEQIPNPANATEPIIPCGNSTFDNRPVLQQTSCLAQQYYIYIVLDMGDLQPCNITTDSNCPSDGRFQYNTQVAFSPDGELLAKYHKIHLFQENYYNPADPPLPVTFKTNFGVTFGMIICFDMLFETPSFDYAREGVTDIVFSTAWVNEPPVQTATQAQLGWSTNYQANIIAANLGTNFRTSGSGIYQNGTALVSFYNPTTNSSEKLLIATLSTNENSRAINENTFEVSSTPSIHTNIQPNHFIIKTFKATKGSSGSFYETVTNLTCSINYTVSETNPGGAEDLFGLAAVSAANLSIFLPSPFMYCGLFRCTGGKLELCSFDLHQGLESNTNFSSISVWGTFQGDSFGVLPFSASNEGVNLPSELVRFKNAGSWASYYTNPGSSFNVLDFGIFSATED